LLPAPSRRNAAPDAPVQRVAQRAVAGRPLAKPMRRSRGTTVNPVRVRGARAAIERGFGRALMDSRRLFC